MAVVAPSNASSRVLAMMSCMSGQVASGGPAAASQYRERNSTADRALDILGLFCDTRLCLSAQEVAQALGTARSTAYRYVQSLVGAGFLEEAPAGGFRLGPRVLELGRLARRSYGLSDVALPIIDASGAVTAAVSVAALDTRVPDERLPEVVAAVVDAAARVSDRLALAD